MNPGDTFRIKGLASERHYHDKLEQQISRLEVQLAGLRAEWDEFIAAVTAAEREPCCDLHGRTCEPPSELCCRDCTEAGHPLHQDGRPCSNPDLSGGSL